MASSVNRSARTGRFVSNATAARWPQYTTTEPVGAGTSNSRPVVRDAGSGRFVPRGRAQSDSARTITQRV
ncbi:ABC transporter ATP-binding protein [Rathayibacter tritici]|nr:ABC transporter ATP-binding protein [Rathayibacter tritici]PPG08036.1 ABC transporter ATP-binding protein [Rathayibacter tritici]